jgi:phage-related protein
MRELYHTEEFDEFYKELPQKVRNKFDYCLNLLETLDILSTKLVKKVVSSKFYELRVSVNNEYRTLLFAVDSENLIIATKIILLNGFLKKSNKDYGREIQRAERLLNNIEL